MMLRTIKSLCFILNRQSPPFGYSLARKILKPIKKKLGLAKATYLACGAGALRPDTHDFFSSLDMIFCSVYGKCSLGSNAVEMRVIFYFVLICLPDTLLL